MATKKQKEIAWDKAFQYEAKIPTFGGATRRGTRFTNLLMANVVNMAGK